MNGVLTHREGRPKDLGLIDAVEWFFGGLIELGFEVILEVLIGGFFELM